MLASPVACGSRVVTATWAARPVTPDKEARLWDNLQTVTVTSCATPFEALLVQYNWS